MKKIFDDHIKTLNQRLMGLHLISSFSDNRWHYQVLARNEVEYTDISFDTPQEAWQDTGYYIVCYDDSVDYTIALIEELFPDGEWGIEKEVGAEEVYYYAFVRPNRAFVYDAYNSRETSPEIALAQAVDAYLSENETFDDTAEIEEPVIGKAYYFTFDFGVKRTSMGFTTDNPDEADRLLDLEIKYSNGDLSPNHIRVVIGKLRHLGCQVIDTYSLTILNTLKTQALREDD